MMRLVCNSVVALAIFAFPVSLSALTVSEYNGLSNQDQNTALSRVVEGTFHHYRDKGAREAWQTCVRAYFSQQEIIVNDEAVIGVPGANAVLGMINSANSSGQIALRVEEIVFGAITAECGQP